MKVKNNIFESCYKVNIEEGMTARKTQKLYTPTFRGRWYQLVEMEVWENNSNKNFDLNAKNYV